MKKTIKPLTMIERHRKMVNSFELPRGGVDRF